MSWTRVSRVEGSIRTRGKIDTGVKRKGKDKRIIGESEFMTNSYIVQSHVFIHRSKTCQ